VSSENAKRFRFSAANLLDPFPSQEIPAFLLQQFVTTDGISGTFALTRGDHHKNSRRERLK